MHTKRKHHFIGALNFSLEYSLTNFPNGNYKCKSLVHLFVPILTKITDIFTKISEQ